VSKILPVGKLPMELLEKFIGKYSSKDERIVVGSQIGEDATVIDFGDKYLVAKSDPITFVTEDIGHYVIQINANDIATMGARPKWFLATLLLPDGKTTEKLVEEIFSRTSQACRELGISLCGGHAEITSNLDRPIIIGQMLGEVDKDKLVKSSGVRVGDDILLTKGIAIEGTSIIARERGNELKEKFGKEFLQRVMNYLHDPGISVVREALLAVESGEVHAMHDPTEGGLSTGLYELSKASRTGMIIYEDRIPILPECQALCGKFELHPLGLMASGALIIVLPSGDSEKLIALYRQEGIHCSIIGKAVEEKSGLSMGKGKLPYFERDEITRILIGRR